MNIDLHQPWLWAVAAGAALLLFPNLFSTITATLGSLGKSVSSLTAKGGAPADNCQEALLAVAQIHRRLEATGAPPEAFDQLGGLVKFVLCSGPDHAPEKPA